MHSIEVLTKPFAQNDVEHATRSGSFLQTSVHATKVLNLFLQRTKHPSLNVKNHKKHTNQQAVENEQAVEGEEMQTIPLLAKCVSFIMKRGQKAKAASTMNAVIKTLQRLSPQKGKNVDALHIIHTAINNVKPAFELRKARFGGRTQFIPATLPVHKQENQALRALVQTARAKHKKAAYTNKHHEMYTFAYFLAQEIYDAYKHQGAACQAKHGIHKQAEHNRNHVRRRWW